MSARNIAESTVTLIRDEIKSKIAGALSDLRIERGDAAVSTEPPPTQSYFIYEGAKAYKAPAIFVILDNIDHRLNQGQNFICSLCKVNVSVVVEDRDKTALTTKAWRYQDALHFILSRAQLESANKDVRLVIKVVKETFSPTYSDTKDSQAAQSIFRKEVLLECEVEHYEQE